MIMTSHYRTQLERQRLLRVAKEYQQNGFDVTLHPAAADLPAELAGCAIDLIARRGETAIAVEVRTKETLTLNGSADLRKMTERVSQLPNWEFELVLTNPRRHPN
jgi:Holliday junction resolvase